MSNTKQVKAMLQRHGLSETEYDKIVEDSGMDKDGYDNLAMEYNAPRGITWEELAKRYNEEHPDINIEEYLDRVQIMLERGENWKGEEIKDIQAFAKEVEKNIKEFRKKAKTKPTTGESAELQQKKAKLHSLYLKYKEKGHSQKEVHNILQARHFPDWSIDTIITYLKK